ncbi:MAG: hypothetical protein ABSB19_13440 [Methylomonas sp.]
MSPEILLVVLFTAIIQSIFGVGVLLFGTPIMLLLGYDFVNILAVLLPISLSISLFQISKHHVFIDFQFFRKVLFLTLPAVAISLLLVTHAQINIGLLVGVFLLLIAFKEVSADVGGFIDGMMRHETVYFVVMGVVHGLSSLGGSMLTALAHQKGYAKNAARVTIAACYATFMLTQIVTLGLFRRGQIDVSLSENTAYLVIGVLVYVLTDEMVYEQINRDKYRHIFSVFLGFSGLVLMLKSTM